MNMVHMGKEWGDQPLGQSFWWELSVVYGGDLSLVVFKVRQEK
jgi:hypothetical protein